MDIQTRNLGLAAYIMMYTAKVVSVENKVFHLSVLGEEKEWSLRDWELAYTNSDENKHDTLLVSLRNLMSAN